MKKSMKSDNELYEMFCDWELFPESHKLPIKFIRTSRSCPFQCSFCNYPRFGGKYEPSSVGVVIKEMETIHEVGTKYLIFTDDTLNVPLDRFKAILRQMISRQFKFQWIAFFRCSHADEELFDLMKQSGCLAVYLGFESGSNRVLQRMNKKVTVERYKEVMSALHKNGIITFGSFVIGHPGETDETVQETYRFIQETAPTFFNAQMFFLDPLSPIGMSVESFGISGSHYRWWHETMGWEEASKWTNYILRSVTQSIQLPLWGFSIWSIPYLLVKGFSLNDIKMLTATTQEIIIRRLDNEYASLYDELQNIQDILQKHINNTHGLRIGYGLILEQELSS